jgi:hypothetical protein
MQIVKKKVVHVIAGMLLLLITSCEKSFLSEEESRQKQLKHEKEINDFTDHPDSPRVAYPTIQHVTYIPRDPANAHTKCLAWKISWPANQDMMAPDQIPTMFSYHNGALNSFKYLNAVDPMNTFNTTFSLYYENKFMTLENLDLIAQLTHFNKINHLYYHDVFIGKLNESPATVESWVKENPGILETNVWNNISKVDHFEYQEGDMFIFHEQGYQHNGIVRIVSMQPRVIEVYLAVPNK